jgi:hypothetical protein
VAAASRADSLLDPGDHRRAGIGFRLRWVAAMNEEVTWLPFLVSSS